MSLAPKDIYEKEFAISKHGYDQVQVDNFLDEVILELQQRERAYNDMRSRLEQLSVSAPVKPAVSDETRAGAENIIDEAKTRASQITMEARNKAEQLISEAKARIASMVSDYKEQSAKLVSDRDMVKQQYNQICKRFYNMLETQKKALETHYKPETQQMLGTIPLERVSKEETGRSSYSPM